MAPRVRPRKRHVAPGGAWGRARGGGAPAGGRLGATVVELVVVLAVLGLAAGVAWRLARPAGAVESAAGGARALLLWSRLEAVWTGDPVAVVAASGDTLAARSGPGCSGRELRRLELRRYGRVTLSAPTWRGVVWLPTGGARSCRGGGVVSGRLVVAGGSREVAVVMSSLGRVRIERLP